MTDANGVLSAVFDPVAKALRISGGGGGGTVDSVVAGTDINVDNTDPANPIVNFIPSSGADTSAIHTGDAAGGDLTGTYPNPTLASVVANPGTYGGADTALNLAINVGGQIHGNVIPVAIQIAESQVTDLTTDLGNKQSTTLTNAHVLVGNGSNVATDVAVSGDVSLANTGAVTLATVNSNTGTFGDATHVAQVTLDGKGRATAASNVLISGTAPGGSAGGDLTGTYPNPTLAGVITAGGPQGDASHTQVLTWDAKGRLLTVTNTAIAIANTAVSGLGTMSTVNSPAPIGNGGTGQTSATAAFNALSPQTTRGDIITRDATNDVRLGIGTSGQLLKTDGTDPSWGAVSLASGSAGITGILTSANGGTGNGFAKLSGPTTSEKTFTLPNTSATVLTDNAAVTVAQGGTGLAALTAHDLIIGNGTSAPTLLAPSATSGVALISQGSSADPAYGTINLASTSIVTGTLPVGNGGTGIANPTAHDLLIGNGSSAMTQLAPSATSGVPLISQGTSSDPAYGTVAIAGGGTGATTASAARSNLGLGTAAVSDTHAFEQVVNIGWIPITSLTASAGATNTLGFPSSGDTYAGALTTALTRSTRIWDGSTFYGVVYSTTLSAGLIQAATTNASTDTVTSNGHNYSNGDAMYFDGLSGIGGLTNDTTYWVIGRTANTFQVSTTQGGSAVNITSNESPTISPGTTVTLVANGSYALTAGNSYASIFFSYEANPAGYPGWFSHTTTQAVNPLAYTGFTATVPTNDAHTFSVTANLCTYSIAEATAGTSNATTFTINSPIVSATKTNAKWYAAGQLVDAGTGGTGSAQIPSASSTITFGKGAGAGGFTNSGNKQCSGLTLTYPI